MNVFVDFHHAGLLNSLIMLFEKRLGGRVYRPIGMEWAEKGFWKVYDHPATQQQYLAIGGATPDGTDPLNEVVVADGSVFHCYDIDSDQTNRAITFEGFMKHDFDYVIATLPQHIEPFRKLCDMHPSHPKLIYQIGNSWNMTNEQTTMIDGLMASAKLNLVANKPYVSYHQEFDLSLFRPDPTIVPTRAVNSFVNCFSVDGIFSADWQLFQRIEEKLKTSGFVFHCYGGQCRDGAMHGAKEVALAMQMGAFVWHTKVGGDGYGHVLHNAFACGKLVIARFSQYEGKLGRDLLVDGATAINIDTLSDDDIVRRIRESIDPFVYKTMCRNAYSRFKEIVDFDREEQEIRAFLESL